MKQYRLKITWSNGDSEYPACMSIREELLEVAMQHLKISMAVDHFRVPEGSIVYSTKLIRKFEYEEVKGN